MEAANYFNIVIMQILNFVVYALIGAYAVKSKVISKDGLNVLSAFIIRIALPVMIFIYTINGTTRKQFWASLPVLALGALMFLGLFTVGYFISGFLKLRGNERKVYRACFMFGNVGFMGIPILMALLPGRGMLYMSLFTIIDQLCLWTIGLSLCTPENTANGMTTKEKLLKMLNPATIAITLATILLLLEIKLPLFLNTALMKVGNCATPLALAYLGGMFVLMDITKYVRKIEFYALVMAKMVLFPVIFYNAIKLIPGLNPEIVLTISVLSSMSCMSAIPMIAQSQGSAGEYAAGLVFVTTVCLIFTLPLVCLFIG